MPTALRKLFRFVTARPLLTLGAAASIIAAQASAQAAAPSNDNFANRIKLTGSPVAGTADSTGATRESFERDETGYYTVWWTWTAPANGTVTINIQGTGFSQRRFAVFNGATVDELAMVGTRSGDDSLVFPTVAGAVYQIAVGSGSSYNSSDSSYGNVVLNIRNGSSTVTSPTVVGTPANANDGFAARTTLTGSAVSGIGYNYDSTRESLEPTDSGYETLWWTWTAPVDGTVTMDLEGTDFSHDQITVYNGSRIDQLSRVDTANEGGTVGFPTVAGTVYQIAVGCDSSYNQVGYSVGSIVLNVTLGEKTITSATTVEPVAAANDDFSKRTTLTGTSVTGIGHPLDATRESNEPADTIDGDDTLWWTWTAPKTTLGGILSVDAAGTNFTHYLTAYTGTDIGSLGIYNGQNFQGDQSTPAKLLFAVEPGQTIQFSVGTKPYNNTNNNSIINLSLAPHPSFFNGEATVGKGFYYLRFPSGAPFGYYNYASYPYLFHSDLGFECFFDAHDGKNGAYLYDFKSSDFFYTSPSFPFPYLYDFGLRAVLYYYPDTKRPGHYTTNPRYFYNYSTGKIITK